MSLSSKERRNPPPRQKSCKACTKAKRRCDLALPSCLRCSQRQLVCEYASRKGSNGPVSVSEKTKAPPPDTHFTPMTANLPLPTPAPSEQTSQSPTAGCPHDHTGGSLEEFCPELLPFTFLPEGDSIGVIHHPSILAPPRTKELHWVSEVISNRLSYALEVIKSAPFTMALEAKTPWSHAELYKKDMPDSMEDAFAACALYAAKNQVNAAFVMRSLERRAQKLLAAPLPTSARHCLANTHALLLYQIIRLFDGDITARASAERAITALEDSASVLFRHVRFHSDNDEAEDLPISPLASTSAFWEDWIFQESMRRTLVLTYFVLQVYRLLSGQLGLYCDGRLGLCHSMTLSAHLWEARTAFDFALAWKSHCHFVVTDARFDQMLQRARPDDWDTFGKILMSSLIGVDEARAWFATRGGTL